MTDDVLLEVRRAREAFAAEHGYDLRAMVAALRRMDAAGDRTVVCLPPRRPEVLAAESPVGAPAGLPTPNQALQPTPPPVALPTKV